MGDCRLLIEVRQALGHRSLGFEEVQNMGTSSVKTCRRILQFVGS